MEMLRGYDMTYLVLMEVISLIYYCMEQAPKWDTVVRQMSENDRWMADMAKRLALDELP